MGGRAKSVYKTVIGKGGLAGLGASFGLSLASHLLRKPGLRAYTRFLVRNLFHAREEMADAPASVHRHTDAMVRLFQEKGFKPSRIAIDGVPGSGKSTLARVLAEKLGMSVVCLDHQDMDSPRSFEQKNSIYEHHRLLRTQDIDAFDLLIYIDEPVTISKTRVLDRKRGAYLVDLLEYDRLKKVGESAFDFAAGESLSIQDSHLKLKFKPAEGFKDRENIDAALGERGIDGTALAKEEALFLVLENTARKGFKAYLNLHAFDQEVLAALTESMLLSGKGRWRR